MNAPPRFLIKSSLVTVGPQDSLHRHPGYEVRYILSGQGRFLREKMRPLTVKPHDLVWNPPQVPHIMSGDPFCTFISFWLEESFPMDDRWLCRKMDPAGVMGVGNDVSVFFQKIRVDVQSSVAGISRAADLRLLAYLYEFFARGETKGGHGGGDLQVRECLAILSAEPFRNHPLGPLAEYLGLSVSQLIRRFKGEMGMAPGQFLTGLRLEEACRRLANSRQTLEEIAEATGTGDGYSFAKLFKRHLGVSPGRWRTMKGT